MRIFEYGFSKDEELPFLKSYFDTSDGLLSFLPIHARRFILIK